jgi:acetyl-CoA acetyltransferase
MSASIKDKIAIVGVGTTGFYKDAGKSVGALVLDACVSAIRDAGLNAADVDGISGSLVVPARYVQNGLGIPACTWHANLTMPMQHQLIEAMNAVYSGACSTALVYHGVYRAPGASRSAAEDPFRTRFGPGTNVLSPNPDTFEGAVGTAPWAASYLHRYGVDRQVFGKIAINSRSNAIDNVWAACRAPLTMSDYLSARYVRKPLCLLDLDYPVDGADALIVTTTDRARDLKRSPILIHVATLGQNDRPYSAQMFDLSNTGQQVATQQLWRRSDIGLEDMDVFYPYDGFSFLAVRWFEAVGYCGDGEAQAFFEDNWHDEQDRLLINGRVGVNTHGGSLSEGATQGSGHIREAVLQLRNEAGSRQILDARHALIAQGGLFFNAGAIVLRAA